MGGLQISEKAIEGNDQVPVSFSFGSRPRRAVLLFYARSRHRGPHINEVNE